MNENVLSVVIPTFNRLNTLKKTISPLLEIQDRGNIEILVIDNCSNDGTWEWLSEVKKKLDIKIQRNRVNIGIEGNIIRCLFCARGEYVWLLSDHTVPNPSEIELFVKEIENGMKFDVGYARIEDYESVLPSVYTPMQVEQLDSESLGKFLFLTSNISSFVINSAFLAKCGRSVHRFSGFSYPHLGVYLHLTSGSSLVELGVISSFYKAGTSSVRLSYDTFRSRFLGFSRAVSLISSLNEVFQGTKKGAFKSRSILSSLAYNSVLSLCYKDNVPKPSEFIYCAINYPGFIKIFLFTCSFIAMLPTHTRQVFSKFFFSLVTNRIFKIASKNNRNTYYDETIKE